MCQFQTLAHTSCSPKRRLQTVSVIASNSGRRDKKVEVFCTLAKRGRDRILRIGYAKIDYLDRRRCKKGQEHRTIGTDSAAATRFTIRIDEFAAYRQNSYP
jgi:hypothetical protein